MVKDSAGGAASEAKLPPIWLMGMTQLPLGISGAVALLITPQLLAAQGTPEPRIAAITSLGLAAGFAAAPLSPLLDLWVSRKAYAIGFTVAGAVFAAAALLTMDRLDSLGWLLFASLTCIGMAVGATGGWFAGLVSKADDARLAAWFTTANIAGFGITAMVGASLMRGLPAPLGGLMLGVLTGAPALICMAIPGAAAGGHQARESFGRFFGDIGRLLRDRATLLTVLLFASPAASFDLTNALGGFGRDYHASEKFVSLVGGAGGAVAGVIGSLAVPRIAERVAGRKLYIGIGVVGSLFTLAVIFLPRVPAVFAVAMAGENIAQAAAFAASSAIALRMIGKDNPLAATTYSVLVAAVAVPLVYMQLLDGNAYGAWGIRGAYATDAGLGLTACLLMALVLSWARLDRAKPLSHEGQPASETA